MNGPRRSLRGVDQPVDHEQTVALDFLAVIVVVGKRRVDISNRQLGKISHDFRRLHAAKVMPDVNIPDANAGSSNAGLAAANAGSCGDVLFLDSLILLDVHSLIVA